MSKKKPSKTKHSSSLPSLEIDHAKTEFVYIASHQLRTPLTAIKLLVELLLGDPAIQLHEEQVEYLKNIYQSTGRMVQLVDDLLNVSRIETGTLRVVPVSTNLKSFLETIIAELEPVAQEKKCRISLVCKQPVKPLLIDMGLMHAVFHNLIVNAIKYSKPGSRAVEVVIKKMSSVKGDFVQVQVNDHGIGIPKKEQSRIFEKFFRAENAIQVQTDGSGLGLYIAHKIAKLSDAELHYQPLKD
jgi:signal transduction histidine kinase